MGTKRNHRTLRLRICGSFGLVLVSSMFFFLVVYPAAGEVLTAVMWAASVVLIFRTVWPLKILSRIAAIEEARKQRIAREFHESWARENKAYLKEYDKKIDKYVDKLASGKLYKGGGVHAYYEDFDWD